MKIQRAAVLLSAFLLVGGSPYTNVPPSAEQSRALHVYLGALVHRDYDKAYSLLVGPERAYFQNARNFASVFQSDDLRMHAYSIIAARGNNAGRVFFVKERLSYTDFARNRTQTMEGTIPYGVLRDGSDFRIKDVGHPWKAERSDASSQTLGVAVALRKLSFFPKYVRLLLTFVNNGEGFATILPYRKSVLTDDSGAVYPIIEAKDWRITDRQLFLGLRIAGNAQYTGFLNFEVPRVHGGRSLHLRIAPVMRDGSTASFSVTLPQILASEL